MPKSGEDIPLSRLVCNKEKAIRKEIITSHTCCSSDVELAMTEVIKSRTAKMYAKPVMYGSVYKYRLHATYISATPNLCTKS